MNREEIAHLGTLARLSLTEAELVRLEAELSAIVSYVSTVTNIAGEAEDSAPTVGARFNVFRADEVTNEADQYTEALLSEAPERSGRYLKVKKIIALDE